MHESSRSWKIWDVIFSVPPWHSSSFSETHLELSSEFESSSLLTSVSHVLSLVFMSFNVRMR